MNHNEPGKFSNPLPTFFLGQNKSSRYEIMEIDSSSSLDHNVNEPYFETHALESAATSIAETQVDSNATKSVENKEGWETWIYTNDRTDRNRHGQPLSSQEPSNTYGRLVWLAWVKFMTFFLPISLLLKGDTNPGRILAFKEKMTWVHQTVLFYALVIFGFLIYPSTVCSTITLEVLLSEGIVSASSKLLKNSLLCQIFTFVNFASGLTMFLIVFLAILSGIHSTLKLSYVYKKDPSLNDVPLVMHIPCYSEGIDDLLKTINSCSESDFDDQKKLLFVVCDGIVTGKGNAKPTSDILIDDIFRCRDQKPIPQEYISTELGDKLKNCANCYCGHYEINNHRVSYVLIIKVGTAGEATTTKPGNRGKRDSQLIIYRFFHQVIFSEEKLSKWDPLFKDIAQKMVSLIRKDPCMYEYILVADADTYIYPDGIRELASFLEHSPSYFGVCGETKVRYLYLKVY